jgi:PhzF family phenazine biosynthesis protein
MAARRFEQVDVFTETPYAGNPVAVVHDGEGLSEAEMQRFANWTNLSETTFVLPPADPGADYRVRIFTPSLELPFAGHPTLGTCHAWLGGSGQERVVQECELGLIPIRRDAGGRLAFAAPERRRSGPLDEETLARVVRALGVPREAMVDAAWAVNGPEWIAVLLESADAVLAVRPSYEELDIGIAGPRAEGGWEVRALVPKNGAVDEDPVTGSLNAALGQWLFESGRECDAYVAHQGTALGRAGRVHVSRDGDGTVWVAGGTVTCVSGTVEL